MANLRANNLTGTGGRNAIDGSVFFEGETSYLSMASGAMISGTGFGTNDFTIEFWINQGVNAGDYTGIFNCRSSSTTHRFQVAFKDSKIHVYTDTSTWRDTGYIPTAGVYEHIAFQRDYSGNTLKMYANGEEKWSVSNNRDYNEVFGYVYIGDHGTAYDNYQGYLSNLRVCTHLVYASNYFTPPTQKLGLHSETVLLCCQDSDNPLQEATGKTITGYGNLAAFSSGDNLVTNGTFDSATTGWTSDGTVTIDSNRLKITNDAANYRSALQDITVVVGKAYRVSADCIAGTSNNSNFHVGTTSSSNALASAVTSPVVVRPTETTLRVTLNVGSNTPGHTALYDNVEVREVEPPKAQKVLPPVGIDEGVVFDGYTKMNSQGVMYFPTGDTTQRGRGRGVFAGGYTSVPADAALKRIYYIEIDSMGTSAEFGDTNKAAAWGQSGCSSSTRGLITGGTNPTNLNTIDYITIATTSNALDFGDLSVTHGYTASCSNNTRGLTGGGRGGSPTARLAQIDYNTIATLGNGQDFGDLTQSRMGLGAVASSTRAVFTGGNGSPADPSTVYNTIDYVEFATTANATDFGDMTDEHDYHGSCSSSTRGIIYGGNTSYGPTVLTNIIEYVTIASTGNGTDFGDVRDDGAHAHGTSNSIRGVFAGGTNPYRNSIDFITITTTGNGVDWGDLPDPNGSYAYAAGLSDSHGGIS